jgi:hypothetical protein
LLGFQKVVGHFDVKTTPVYFHAQKSSSHVSIHTMVPFDLLRLNVGNAMSTTGIFVAPKTGKYFFALSGLTEEHKSANVEMQVKTATADWSRVGQAYGTPGYQTYSLQATLDLAKGDQMRLLLAAGAIHDTTIHYTSFVGQLLEEDILH